MNLIRCKTPQDFLERAQAFLVREEACHNLLLGTPTTLIACEGTPALPSYFAVVADAGDVVAAAMMTPPHLLVLSRTEHPHSLRLLAQDLLTAAVAPPGVHAPVPVSGKFAALWQELTGQRYERGLVQRMYRLQRVQPVSGVPGYLRPVTEADRPVVIPWLCAFLMEAFGKHAPPTDAEQMVDRRLRGSTEGLCLWDDVTPRALAGYAGPTPQGIRVGPVYTPPEHRRRGYASVCVAALSELLLARGHRFCVLYTDINNPTSNRIYQRIGYEPLCDVVEYRFSSH